MVALHIARATQNQNLSKPRCQVSAEHGGMRIGGRGACDQKGSKRPCPRPRPRPILFDDLAPPARRTIHQKNPPEWNEKNEDSRLRTEKKVKMGGKKYNKQGNEPRQ